MAKQPMASTQGSAIPLDDALLVEQVRSGDMAAFSRLVTKYQDRVVNTCWRISGNMDDAQDLAQEAFLRAMQSIEAFQQKSGFYTWLFRIAVNLSISHRRKAARVVKLSLHGPDGRWRSDHQAAKLVGRVTRDSDEPSSRLSAKETTALVTEGLEQLDDEYRSVIVLRDIEGFDYQQIAEILEMPIGTVKSRLHRARMDLRGRLAPVLGPE
jgi:RNA polymerase sigma-70 factor, ECF subfamily